MHFEVAYQCEMEQSDFNHANPEQVYCFGECPLKINKMIQEAKKFGHGILFIVNGNKVVRDILF